MTNRKRRGGVEEEAVRESVSANVTTAAAARSNARRFVSIDAPSWSFTSKLTPSACLQSAAVAGKALLQFHPPGSTMHSYIFEHAAWSGSGLPSEKALPRCLRSLPIVEFQPSARRPSPNSVTQKAFHSTTFLHSAEWTLVEGACIVVTSESPTRSCETWQLVSIFIDSFTDKDLEEALSSMGEAADVYASYYPKKCNKNWYTGSTGPRAYGFRGESYFDGLHYFLSPGSRDNPHVEYALRTPSTPPATDVTLSKLITAMHALEWKHAPTVASARFKLASDIGHLGTLPGLPLEYASATSFGLSRGFGCNLHTDSGVLGITETICFRKPSDPIKQLFAVSAPRLVFDIGRAPFSILYMSPQFEHGTLPTHAYEGRSLGEADLSPMHDGIGTVLMTKYNLTAYCVPERLRQLRARMLDQQQLHSSSMDKNKMREKARKERKRKGFNE